MGNSRISLAPNKARGGEVKVMETKELTKMLKENAYAVHKDEFWFIDDWDFSKGDPSYIQIRFSPKTWRKITAPPQEGSK